MSSSAHTMLLDAEAAIRAEKKRRQAEEAAAAEARACEEACARRAKERLAYDLANQPPATPDPERLRRETEAERLRAEAIAEQARATLTTTTTDVAAYVQDLVGTPVEERGIAFTEYRELLDSWDSAVEDARRMGIVNVDIGAMEAAVTDIRSALDHVESATDKVNKAFGVGIRELLMAGSASFPVFYVEAGEDAARMQTFSALYAMVTKDTTKPAPLDRATTVMQAMLFLHRAHVGARAPQHVLLSSLFLARISALSAADFTQYVARLYERKDLSWLEGEVVVPQPLLDTIMRDMYRQPIWTLSDPPVYNAANLLQVCNQLVVPYITDRLFVRGYDAALVVPVLNEISQYTGSATSDFTTDARYTTSSGRSVSLTAAQAEAIGVGINAARNPTAPLSGVRGISVLNSLHWNKTLEETVVYSAVAPFVVATMLSALRPPRADAMGALQPGAYGALEFVLPLVALAGTSSLWDMYLGVQGVDQDFAVTLSTQGTRSWMRMCGDVAYAAL